MKDRIYLPAALAGHGVRGNIGDDVCGGTYGSPSIAHLPSSNAAKGTESGQQGPRGMVIPRRSQLLSYPCSHRTLICLFALLWLILSPSAFASHGPVHNLLMKVPLVKHAPQADGTITRDREGNLRVKDRKRGDEHGIDEVDYQRYLAWIRFQQHATYSLLPQDMTRSELAAYTQWLHSPQGERPPTPYQNRAR